MLQIVTSANVACGFHAGDPSTLRAVCDAAVANGVAIGAQVGYPDLLGFGRRAIDIDPLELRDVVLYQLGALDAFAQVAGSEVAYVKPHGALYHATVHDERPGRAPWSPRPPSTTPRSPCSAPRARSCCGPPRRPGWSRCRRRSSTAPTCATGASCRGRSPDALIVEPSGGGASRPAGRRARGRRRPTARSSRSSPLAVRPRRHAGRGGAGTRRRDALGAAGIDAFSPSVTVRLLPYGPAAWLLEVDVAARVLAAAAAAAGSRSGQRGRARGAHRARAPRARSRPGGGRAVDCWSWRPQPEARSSTIRRTPSRSP